MSVFLLEVIFYASLLSRIYFIEILSKNVFSSATEILWNQTPIRADTGHSKENSSFTQGKNASVLKHWDSEITSLKVFTAL